jgi:hypothetical protein
MKLVSKIVPLFAVLALSTAALAAPANHSAPTTKIAKGGKKSGKTKAPPKDSKKKKSKHG